MLAGVYARAGDYFGIDVTLVRVVVAVISLMTGGAGVLAYLVAWIIIPEEGEQNSIAENVVTRRVGAPSGLMAR